MPKRPTGADREIFDLPDLSSRRTVPYLLQYLARLMTGDFQSPSPNTGVPTAQSFVLRELWREQPISQLEISQRLDIGKASVSQSLKRMERDGFICRSRSSSDGRTSVVHLTNKGSARSANRSARPRVRCATLKGSLARSRHEHWKRYWSS